MTLDRVLKYLKKNKQEDTEIAYYNSSEDNNHFNSFYSLIIEDNFKGNIVCLEDVIIKKNASFSGWLVCKKCIVEGSVTGNLLSTEYIEVGRSAFLNAEILSGSIFIENQAVAMGDFRISKDIVIPESYKDLERLYQHTVIAAVDTETKSDRPKKIILKPRPIKIIHKLPREIYPPPEQQNPIPGTECKSKPSEPDSLPPIIKEKVVINNIIDKSTQNTGWW